MASQSVRVARLDDAELISALQTQLTALQTLIAAAVAKSGGEVRLCLEDLTGNYFFKMEKDPATNEMVIRSVPATPPEPTVAIIAA